MLPEGPAIRRGRKRAHEDEEVNAPEVADPPVLPDGSQDVYDAPPPPSVISRAYNTLVNAFGIFRKYVKEPERIPDNTEQNSSPDASEEDNMTIEDIIAPFPNLSAFRYQHVMAMFDQTTDTFQAMLSKVISSLDFVHTDLHGLNWSALREKVSLSSRPWEDIRRGWRSGQVTINIPTMRKDKAKKTSPDNEGTQTEGEQYTVDDELWYRPILPLLKSILTSDESKTFHYDPYEQWWRRPGTEDSPVRVYDELFTADAWLEEHRKVQEIELPPEEDDSYPRAIAAIMLWSDSTHLADFGSKTLWPIYMSLGNQSKYDRAKPGAHAMHHIAYMPSVSLLHFHVFYFTHLRSSFERRSKSSLPLSRVKRQLIQPSCPIVAESYSTKSGNCY